jgi:hypothetical protein
MFCIHCTYKNSDGGYNPKTHVPRNFDQLVELCKLGEQGMIKKYSLKEKELTALENNAIVTLKTLGVHPSVHPFHSVPMGFENNIYKTPYDLLHTFPAGTMKTLVFSVLVIMLCASDFISRSLGT